jgi:hypothetical protein
MSNTHYARIMGTTCTTVVVLAVCGPEQVPSPLPNFESVDEPTGRHPDLPSPDELELCFRRVPIPRC